MKFTQSRNLNQKSYIVGALLEHMQLWRQQHQKQMAKFEFELHWIEEPQWQHQMKASTSYHLSEKYQPASPTDSHSPALPYSVN